MPVAVAWLAGPSVALATWWYVLSWRRYGDPTGSDALFEKFGRQPTGTLLSALTTKGSWEYAFRTIVTRRLEVPLPGDPYGWYRIALWIAIAGVVAAAVLVVRSKGVPRTAWASVALVSLVPVLLTAQHRAGGGTAHPRYLFPMLPLPAPRAPTSRLRSVPTRSDTFVIRWESTTMNCSFDGPTLAS